MSGQEDQVVQKRQTLWASIRIIPDSSSTAHCCIICRGSIRWKATRRCVRLRPTGRRRETYTEDHEYRRSTDPLHSQWPSSADHPVSLAMLFCQNLEDRDMMRRTERCDAIYRPCELWTLGKISGRDPSLHEERLSIQNLHLEHSAGPLPELDCFFQL